MARHSCRRRQGSILGPLFLPIYTHNLPGAVQAVIERDQFPDDPVCCPFTWTATHGGGKKCSRVWTALQDGSLNGDCMIDHCIENLFHGKNEYATISISTAKHPALGLQSRVGQQTESPWPCDHFDSDLEGAHCKQTTESPTNTCSPSPARMFPRKSCIAQDTLMRPT